MELTGQPYRPETPATDSGHAGIPALRLALQRAAMPGFAALDSPPRPVRAVEADLVRLETWR
ncbi:MAG: helix-turn-helix protein [Actinomycetota bacterium]|nr:helix-turn-helix protein [Actinomycetota bacterium]